MNRHIPTAQPHSRTATRSTALVTAVATAAAMAAMTASGLAHAIPIQHTATLVVSGTFQASPTAASEVLTNTVAKLVFAVDTDDMTSYTTPSADISETFMTPVRSASLELGGSVHPISPATLGFFGLRAGTISMRIRGVYPINPAAPTAAPGAWYYAFAYLSPADPNQDPAPPTIAGTYLPLAELGLPTGPTALPPLAFTDGASLLASDLSFHEDPALTRTLYWETKLLPTTKPFSFFGASVLKKLKESELEVTDNFTLAADSNGISPTTEAVKVTVGSYSVTVAAGGFKKGKGNVWTYATTKVAGVQRKLKLTQTAATTYRLVAELYDTTAGLVGVVKGAAADVSLKIGDDTGTQNVVVR